MAFNLKNAIDGSVQSQGIKVSVDAWLDMGSKEWQDTPPEIKAAAYQAAKLCGWTDDGLTSFMLKEYTPRIDAEWAKTIIQTLHELSQEYPLEIESQHKGNE